MAIIIFLPTVTPIASQINLRELAHAKSRTFSASKIQVFVFVSLLDSFLSASAGVIIKSGSLAFLAALNLLNCTGLSTCEAFCNTPVDATT